MSRSDKKIVRKAINICKSVKNAIGKFAYDYDEDYEFDEDEDNEDDCYLGDQFLDLRNGLFIPSAVDHRGASNNAAQQITHGNTGSGIAVIDTHNSHFTHPPLFHNLPPLYTKKTKK